MFEASGRLNAGLQDLTATPVILCEKTMPFRGKALGLLLDLITD